MHRGEDGRIYFDGGEEEVERRMFEASGELMMGAGEFFRMFFRELHRASLDGWESLQRVRKLMQDQGFIGPDDALDYDFVQRGFLVRRKGATELKGRIAALQTEKGHAVDERDFEKAAGLRDYAEALSARLQAGEPPKPQPSVADIRNQETSPAGSDDATI